MLAPGNVLGCACGCGVFDVGTSSMFPGGPGGMAFLEYDYQDQNRNWSGTSQAPAANNDDKEIQTHFVTFGLQYMFNWNWGIQAQMPFDFRYFKTKDDAGDIVPPSSPDLRKPPTRSPTNATAATASAPAAPSFTNVHA